MLRLSCSTRPLLSFMASGTLRWWPSALAQRVSPVMLRFRRVSRFPREPRDIATINPMKDDEPGKPDRCLSVSSANVTAKYQNNKLSTVTQSMENIIRGTTLEVIAEDGRSHEDGGSRVASQFIYDKRDTLGYPTHNRRGGIVSINGDEVYCPDLILPKSGHCDGSIYRNLDRWWKSMFHIADRNEMDGGLVELYGYIAVRDKVDPLLNYVVNFRRDDPIVVEQGSLINMTGPKRGIDMMDHSPIEYDMRIKTGKDEKDDLQLIDGASLIGPLGQWDVPLTFHIPGSYGTVGITLARFNSAVEATVEVLISEVQSGFNLSLSCSTSQLNKEIWLFHGSIAESQGLKSSVVAVPRDSSMDLKFEVTALSSISDQHYCSFVANVHGHDTQEIKTMFALISVKVTWSVLPIRLGCLY